MLKKFLVLVMVSVLFTTNSQAFAQYDDTLVVLHTDLGKMVIEFFPEDAPNHVKNFITLSENGFYDNTVFHRIIKDFMIQGGDPKTKPDSGAAESEWGTGGPDESIDAEFSTIKHVRGIVSMARSADPNSAGSQFFIVHKDSNFLDEQYTVFGRLATQESFETLDRIANIATGSNDRPVSVEQVRINEVQVVSRSEINDLLDLSEPARTISSEVGLTGNQLYENKELDVSFSAPAGWLLQEPDETQPGTPDIVAVGPKTGPINPVISLTITFANGSLDDLIQEKQLQLQSVIESEQLQISNQEKIILDGKDAYVTEAIGLFNSNDEIFNVQFKEIIISADDRFFTLAYSNGVDNFEEQLPLFEETVASFAILSEEADKANETENSEGGGCLIATATYGTELAPQVQKLRELRDDTLLQSESGTKFMESFNGFYYSFSPVIADYERENPIFKEAVKIAITPMISSMSILNYVDVDSEAEVLGYGISLIILNLGMYLAVPAVIIHRLRK